MDSAVEDNTNKARNSGILARMAKISEELKELQRLINRISPLDGVCLTLGHQRYLLSFDKIEDPEPLLEAFAQETQEGEHVALFQKTFALNEAPRQITSKWLATSQRDVLRLESPGLLSIVEAHPKLFKGRAVSGRWLESIRERLDTLRAQDEPAPSLSALLSSLIGAERASWVSSAIFLLVDEHQKLPQRAARRVELLALRLSQRANLVEEAEYQGLIEDHAEQAREAQRLPGRSRRKKLWQIVEALYFWPDPPTKKHNDDDRQQLLSETLAEAVREIGASLRRTNRGASTVDFQRRAQHTLACYALLFPPREALQVSREQLSRLQKKWRLVKETLRVSALSFEDVSRLLALPLTSKKSYPHEDGRMGSLATWISEGVSIDELEAVALKGLLPELLDQSWETSVARSYCRWVVQLAPHYEQRGVTLAITAKTFEHLQRAKNEELALLAQCLLAQEASESSGAAQRQIAILDVTLSLFRRLPQQIKDCLKGLDEIPSGVGARRFSALCEWLKSGQQLDRYLYYCSLAGEDPELSHSLLEDFSRVERRQRERAYLSSLMNPTELQQKMLSRLAQDEAPIDPARTLRRLEERANELLQKIYQARLDALIAQSFLRAYGLALPKITPAWRDIFRFYHSIEENRELLGLLLQRATAQPGVYFPPSLPENKKWLQEAAKHFDVNVWTSPRTLSIRDGEGGPTRVGEFTPPRLVVGEVGEVTIELEDDPIEVLRMGVPFDTCLSLEDGSNAASTVLNALDVNKRVIYVKRDGAIVARQMLAISSSYHLLCYRYYTSLDKKKSPELEARVNEFIVALATEAKLMRASYGEPATIHQGFWYDDGVIAVEGSQEVDPAVQRYCEALGLTPPKDMPESVVREATGWLAMQEERVEEAASRLSGWDGAPSDNMLGDWLYQRLGHAECLRRFLAGEDKLLRVLLRGASRQGTRPFFACVRQVARGSDESETLYRAMVELELTPSDLLSFTKEANVLAARSERMNDHGIEHGLAYELPLYVARLSMEQLFDLLDEAHPLWEWVVSQQSDCDVCIETAVHKIVEESVRAYLRDPDKRLVLSCLQDKRRSVLSRRVALRLVALFPMPKRENPQHTALCWLERGVSNEVSLRNALLELSRDASFAGEPDLLAAMLRQGASQDEVERLRRCKEEPFDALDNLLMQLDWLGPWLQKRYPAPACEPKDWHPHLWDLYFHRRFATPWRKALRQAITDDSQDSQRIAQHIYNLGDIESATRLQQERRDAPRRPPQGWDPGLLTEDIRWQLDPAHQTFSDFLVEWRDVKNNKIDAVLLAAALRMLDEVSVIDEELSVKDPVSRALCVVFSSGLPDWVKLAVIERFTQERTPWPLAVALRDCAVQEQRLYYRMSSAMLLRLWEQKILRAAIAADLSRMYRNGEARQFLQKMKRAAREVGVDASELLSDWLVSLLAARCFDELQLGRDKELLQEVAKILLARCAARDWVGVYGELPDALSASWFLEILRAQETLPREEIIEAIEQGDGTHWGDRDVRYAWLRELVTPLGPSPSGLTRRSI